MTFAIMQRAFGVSAEGPPTRAYAVALSLRSQSSSKSSKRGQSGFAWLATALATTLASADPVR
jgi:hypothetical protein